MEAEARAGSRRLDVLHLIFTLAETNGQYNEHILPMRSARHISICSFRSQIKPPDDIPHFDGGDSVRGFLRALARALSARRYDVIHAHSPYTGVLVLLGLVLSGRLLRLRSSLVYTSQNSYRNYKRIDRLLLAPIIALFPRLIFCSRAALDSVPAVLRRLARPKSTVVQNAVDFARIERVVRETERRPADDAFTAVSVGRLTEIKDPLCLIRALRRATLDGGRLLFVGEGNLREDMVDEARRCGLDDRVTLAGLVSRDRVFELVAQSDVFVSASWGEGLPVAVLESMACGAPTVLSDIPPHREIVEGVDFVPLVAPGDEEGFAREIARLARMPLGDRRELGERCRKLVEERFSLAAMHAGCERVYQNASADL